MDGYFRQHLNGAKRIVQENEDDGGNTSLEDYQDKHDEALPGGGYKKHSKGRVSRSKNHGSRHATQKTKASKKSTSQKVKSKSKLKVKVKKGTK